MRELGALEKKPKIIDDILFMDDLNLSKSDDAIWTMSSQVVNTYVINLDKDVTDPHHYRQIVKLCLQMSENDVANWNINTFGGDLYSTIMLVDAIRQSAGYHYGIVTLGSSAGSFIALALNDCEVVQHGEIFIHEVQSGNYGSNSNQEKRIMFMKDKQKRFIEDIYADFLTEEEMQRIQNNEELWLSDIECNKRLENRRLVRERRLNGLPDKPIIKKKSKKENNEFNGA